MRAVTRFLEGQEGRKMRVLFLLFIVCPAIEIGLFLLAGKWLGVFPTVLLIILTGVLGALVAKRQGTDVYHRVMRDLQHGKMPGEALLDGICVFIGGLLLMLASGFFVRYCRGLSSDSVHSEPHEAAFVQMAERNVKKQADHYQIKTAAFLQGCCFYLD